MSVRQTRLINFLYYLKDIQLNGRFIEGYGLTLHVKGYIKETEFESELMKVYGIKKTADTETAMNTIRDVVIDEQDLVMLNDIKYLKIKPFNNINARNITKLLPYNELLQDKFHHRLAEPLPDDYFTTPKLMFMGLSALGMLGSMYRQGGKKQKRRRTNKNAIVKNKQKRRRNKSQKKRLSRKKR